MMVLQFKDAVTDDLRYSQPCGCQQWASCDTVVYIKRDPLSQCLIYRYSTTSFSWVENL